MDAGSKLQITTIFSLKTVSRQIKQAAAKYDGLRRLVERITILLTDAQVMELYSGFPFFFFDEVNNIC